MSHNNYDVNDDDDDLFISIGGAALHSFLNHQKKLLDDAEELSNSLRKVFQCNISITDWPNVTCHLKHCKESELYSTIINKLILI